MSEPPAVAPMSKKLMGPQMIFGTEVVSQKADQAYMPGRPSSEINAITRRTRRGRPLTQDSQCLGEVCCISICPSVLMVAGINHSTYTTFCQWPPVGEPGPLRPRGGETLPPQRTIRYLTCVTAGEAITLTGTRTGSPTSPEGWSRAHVATCPDLPLSSGFP